MKKPAKCHDNNYNDGDLPANVRLIHKRNMFVDHSYQRDFDPEASARIANNYDKNQIGILTVVPRDDGRYAVVDGQHRMRALLAMRDVTYVLCAIAVVDSYEEEVNLYLSLNKNRKPIPSLQSFKAKVEAGHPAAIGLHTFLKSQGMPVLVNSNGGSTELGFRCIGALEGFWKRDPQMTREVLAFVVRWFKARNKMLNSEDEKIATNFNPHMHLVKAFCELELLCRRSGTTMLTVECEKILAKKSIDHIMAVTKGRGAKPFEKSLALAHDLNGRRTDKLFDIGSLLAATATKK